MGCLHAVDTADRSMWSCRHRHLHVYSQQSSPNPFCIMHTQGSYNKKRVLMVFLIFGGISALLQVSTCIHNRLAEFQAPDACVQHLSMSVMHTYDPKTS